MADKLPAVIRLHTSRFRVYYEDTDAGGIVYHANHLRFMERARSDWLRVLGVDQRRLAQESGVGFVVSQCSLRFLAPARLEDELDVDVAVKDGLRSVRGASLGVEQMLRFAGTSRLCSTATVRVASVRMDNGRPVPLPQDVVERLCASISARMAAPIADSASPGPEPAAPQPNPRIP